jgi:hypothetical protein
MRPSDSDVRTKRRAEIAARKSFEGHVLKDEGHGRWYCARPDTNNYSFRVTDFRDGLILSGDLGELILVVYGRNPIAWLRGCLRSGNEDYVLSKVPLALRQRDMTALKVDGDYYLLVKGTPTRVVDPAADKRREALKAAAKAKLKPEELAALLGDEGEEDEDDD